MRHNRTWFKNRIGKKVYCDDHPPGEKCEGILVESETVVENLVRMQAERNIRFKGPNEN